MKKSLISLAGILMIGACSTKSNNPLLNATDGQFLQTFASSAFNECNQLFFEPAAVRHPEFADKKSCAQGIQSNAAHAGIADAVKLEHIEDPQVKERYFKLKTP